MKKKNKLLALFMAFVMIFSTLVVPVKEAFAASVEWGKGINTHYYWGPSGDITIKEIKANGKIEPAFCLEPGKSVTTIEGYKETYPKYSDAVWNKLCSIAHVGYNKDKNTNADFAATQAFIWMTIREDVDGWKVDWSQPTNIPNYADKFADIRKELAKMKDYEKKASFNNKDYEITVGETLTITDTNKVLSKFGYKVTHKPNGVSVNISGNKLIIKASKDADASGYIQVKIPNKNMVTDNRYFYHPSSQHVGHVGFKDPNASIINLKVKKYGKLELTKYNSDKSSTIAGTSFKITGPEGYEKTVKTNAEGKAIVNNLVPGKYKAVETNASNGYLIDVTPHSFTIEPNETTSVAITNNEPKGTISIRKSDTYGNKVVGAKFDVIAAKDIKNKAGNKVLHAKGSIVDSLTIGEDGTATTKRLPLGSYNLKETFAPEGYLLNKEVKNVVLSYKDQNTAVVVGSAEYENAEPTGKVSLKKVFTNNTLIGDAKLEGATYELRAKEDITNKAGTKKFYSAGDLVATRVADKEGKMEDITNLPLGKYILKETVASEGCLIDKKEYEVELLYKDQNTAIISKAVTSKE